MSDISKELIRKTIEFWSPKYGYEISKEEAIEIIKNIREYSKVLLDIDRSQKAKSQLDFNDIDSLKNWGFSGFKSIKKLWEDKSSIPKIPGVYLVLNPTGNSEFINPGIGVFFKDRNPNVSISELTDNFVLNSLVVYIGKAGGPTSGATLNSRLGQYLKFGQGKKIGHWGGRLIWQLKNHMDLVLCWKRTPDDNPREIEKLLINDFKMQFGKLPFANLTK